MTLLEIRQKFIDLSGRHDLATTTTDPWDTDAGADFFINSGSRWLDLQQETNKSDAQFDKDLSIGDYKWYLQYCLVVRDIWIKDSEGNRERLTPKKYDWIRDNYPLLGSEDTGTPEYWCQYVSRYAPEQASSGEDIKYVSIMIMPPTDEAVTAEVFGMFHAVNLSDNDDENYWSVYYPDVLVLSAIRALVGFYRNTEAVKDYERQIDSILHGIDVDVAYWGTVEDLQMEG